MLSADVQGWPWLSRIARGLQAAMLLAAAPAPWRISAAAELLDDLERGGDRWTVCLTSLAIGAVYARIDQPDLATRTLRRTEEVAAALGAPVLGAWASVLRTAVAVRQGAPGAEQEAAGVLRGGGRARSEPRGRGGRADPSGSPARTRPALGPSGSTDRGPQRASPGVSLRCLGGFSLAAAGVELPWRELRPRVRALLMLLAMNHGRQLHREQLVDALWPDATLASGIRSLQVAVSSIRQCLGAAGITEDALRRHGDAYALQLPGVSDQLADFERLAHAAGREQGPEALAVEAGGVGPVRRRPAARGRPGRMGGRGAEPAAAAGRVGRFGGGPGCAGRRASCGPRSTRPGARWRSTRTTTRPGSWWWRSTSGSEIRARPRSPGGSRPGSGPTSAWSRPASRDRRSVARRS